MADKNVERAKKVVKEIRGGVWESIKPPTTAEGFWNVWWRRTEDLKCFMTCFEETESPDDAQEFLDSFDNAVIQGIFHSGNGLPAKLADSQVEVENLKQQIAELKARMRLMFEVCPKCGHDSRNLSGEVTSGGEGA